MKLTLLVVSLAAAALAAPNEACGRGSRTGICTTQQACYDKGGFFNDRECGNSLPMGCCYNIPTA
jgi:hypothetical protein